MELTIKDNRFYVLNAGDEKIIYVNESTAVAALKKKIAENEELNPENIELLEVNTEGKQWEIKSVPWSKIAIGLIRGV